MHYAICNMQYAICNMQYAIFNMQYALYSKLTINFTPIDMRFLWWHIISHTTMSHGGKCNAM